MFVTYSYNTQYTHIFIRILNLNFKYELLLLSTNYDILL